MFKGARREVRDSDRDAQQSNAGQSALIDGRLRNSHTGLILPPLFDSKDVVPPYELSFFAQDAWVYKPSCGAPHPWMLSTILISSPEFIPARLSGHAAGAVWP